MHHFAAKRHHACLFYISSAHLNSTYLLEFFRSYHCDLGAFLLSKMMAALSSFWLVPEMWTETRCFPHFSNVLFSRPCMSSAYRENGLPLAPPTSCILNILPSDKCMLLVKPCLMGEVYYFICYPVGSANRSSSFLRYLGPKGPFVSGQIVKSFVVRHT